MNDSCNGFTERKCACCGKKFVMLDPGAWTYRGSYGNSRIRYFCSYGCREKYETAYVATLSPRSAMMRATKALRPC